MIIIIIIIHPLLLIIIIIIIIIISSLLLSISYHHHHHHHYYYYYHDYHNKGNDKPCIAVHCVAGLGRAPVLVAIALIEYGLDPISAVTLIREKRRGAINAVQLAYLESYKPNRSSGKKCTIM